MNGEVVLALRIKNLNRLVRTAENTFVAHLAAHLCIERSSVEHEFVVGLFLLLHFAVAQDMAVGFRLVPTLKLVFTFAEHYPVASFYCRSVASAFLLLLHLCVETFFVRLESLLSTDEFREVEGETVSVEKRESLSTIERVATSCLGFTNKSIEQVDTCCQSAEEAIFLFLDNAGDELLLRNKFGIGSTHLFYEGRDELIDESPLLIQKSVGVAHCTAQNTANHITRFRITGQLTVSNGESDGTEMVSNHTHGHINIFFLSISKAG